jgi:hypothetical protein
MNLRRRAKLSGERIFIRPGQEWNLPVQDKSLGLLAEQSLGCFFRAVARV